MTAQRPRLSIKQIRRLGEWELSLLKGPQSLPRAYLVASSLEVTRLVLTKPRNVR